LGVQQEKYRCFDDLPRGLQNRLMTLHPSDYDEWVDKSIPALANKSILETLNDDGGYKKIAQFLQRVEGYGY